MSVFLPERASSGGPSLASLLLTISSHQKRISSTVQGWPSDHLSPLRKWKVHWLVSALDSQLSARPGPISCPSRSQRNGEWPYILSATKVPMFSSLDPEDDV